MHDSASEESEEVLNLREILHSFGIDDWQNFGPLSTSHGKLPAIPVECQGRCYVLRERPEGHITDQEEVLERLAWAASLSAWLNRVRGSFAEMWQEG